MTTPHVPASAPTWDLDPIFPGGSGSKAFADCLTDTRAKLETLAANLDTLPSTLDEASAPAWITFISTLQELFGDLKMLRSFAGCLVAQNVNDSVAARAGSETDLLAAQWEKVKAGLEVKSIGQTDAAWQIVTQSPQVSQVGFYLDELRNNGRKKMAVEKEALALDLAVNGYHAWNRLYDKMAGDLRVDFEHKGETKRMSLGQLVALMDDPDRSVRKRAFEKINEAWEPRLDLAAMALNSQAGFRLALYKHRNWDSPLFEPLLLNRMSKESLDAMWQAVAEARPRLKRYVDAKKSLLNIDTFCWYDMPVLCGQTTRTITYTYASEFIVEHLSRFSPDLGQFCKMAIEKLWVEAENRSGKRAGAFCASMGPRRQSRVFMTFSGTTDNLFTLAHELGHGYHGFVLKDKPFFATNYPMGLAETASTFNELMTGDASLAESGSADEKLLFTDQSLQQALAYFCDLRSRFLFDSAFYAERKSGVLGKERLSELMIEAQRTAFGDLLDQSGFHPLFWCTKLHFFLTNQPFYNFPYTVGFLFANGVYARAVEEGKGFADRYRSLLADTGGMSTEDVARKHLGVDLTGTEFWRSAVDRALARLDDFVALAAARK